MTVKERLHLLVDAMDEDQAARLLDELHAGPLSEAETEDAEREQRDREFYAHLRAAGLRIIPANPDSDRWAEPLPDLPGVDLSGAVLEEREEALRRWD